MSDRNRRHPPHRFQSWRENPRTGGIPWGPSDARNQGPQTPSQRPRQIRIAGDGADAGNPVGDLFGNGSGTDYWNGYDPRAAPASRSRLGAACDKVRSLSKLAKEAILVTAFTVFMLLVRTATSGPAAPSEQAHTQRLAPTAATELTAEERKIWQHAPRLFRQYLEEPAGDGEGRIQTVSGRAKE